MGPLIRQRKSTLLLGLLLMVVKITTVASNFLRLSNVNKNDSLAIILPYDDVENTVDTADQRRGLKKSSSSSNSDFDFNFNEPVEDWDVDEFLALGVLVLVAVIALCCVCNILQCVLGCLCSLLGCGRRRRQSSSSSTYGYYNDRAPLIPDRNNPPPYNPNYRSPGTSRGMPPQHPQGGRGGNDCTLWDCLAALCCLECCASDGGCTPRNMCCGLCCFEFCWRGGRDVMPPPPSPPRGEYGSVY